LGLLSISQECLWKTSAREPTRSLTPGVPRWKEIPAQGAPEAMAIGR
jgi:hypothetical protein